MDTQSRTVNPATIAREAIRQLTAARLAPTPENFSRAYRDASGGADAGSADLATGVAEAEQVLNQLVRGLAARKPGTGSASKLQDHVRRRAWKQSLKLVDAAISESLTGTSREWPRILLMLLTQIDAIHADWTRARKLGAVRHVLTTSSADDSAREKLQHLISRWNAKPAGQADLAAGDALTTSGSRNPAYVSECDGSVSAPLPVADQSAEVKAWRLLALTALDSYRPPHRREGDPDPSAANGAESLGSRLGKVTGVPGTAWIQEVKAAGAETHAEMQHQVALRDRLVKLLRLLCENLALFADDDAWVNGQVARITQLLDAPFDERTLSETEDSIRLAVQRQTELQADLRVAKVAVKEMLAVLIGHLAAAAASTGEYHSRLTERAESIKAADNLPSLSKVVADLLDDAVHMRESIQRTHGELSAARENTQKYEERVHALEQELVDVSSLVRIDPLTQVLNRRGLEEAFFVAQARSEREGTPLALALLDIDNFKRLNDAHGHQVGDRALQHVSNLVRGSLRPGDTVARYGGEEFVILLPATTAVDAVHILTRTQRQLTRTFFLQHDEKILITFSAGVTGYRSGETHESAIKRADFATYAAKKAGKNRVEMA